MDTNMRDTVRTSRLGAFVLATFALAAGRARAAPNTPAGGPLDDGQVVQRVLAFNRAEVQTAETVKGKLSSSRVWQLAQRMAVDHAALDQKFRVLPTTRQQSSGDGTGDGQADGADLSKLARDALEKAYVGREVKVHESMLAALDHQLIAAASNEELQRRLIDLRAEVVAHLEHARNVHHALEQADVWTAISTNGP